VIILQVNIDGTEFLEKFKRLKVYTLWVKDLYPGAILPN
jgi:hypothetical protein